MIEFFSKLFDTSDFPARWNCGNWSEFAGWFHILSDIAVFGAYAAIPMSIVFYYLRKKGEIVFPRLYWLFAAFILFCGLTHLINAIIFWEPVYRISALMTFGTAIVSWATAIVLIRALPVALDLPGTALLNAALKQRVAENEEANAALRESTMRLGLAIQHSRLGDWWWDPRTDIVTLSPRAKAIFGLPAESHPTWTEMRNLIHPDDRELARIAVLRAVSDRSDYSIDYRLAAQSDGIPVWVAARGRAVYAEDGTVERMIGTLEDISDRKKVEVEREQLLVSERAARNEAEAASRMKDEFLATLSHELRTPLNAVLGWSHLLKNESNPEQVQNGLAVIERNARAQGQLIEDLIDMSRIMTGKLGLEAQPVDPTQIINQALDVVKLSAEARNLTIRRDFSSNTGFIRGDAARLQQVVLNLLTNAIKFTAPGGTITVALDQQDNQITVRVTDTGIGIDPKFLPYVFDRFRQADSSTTRRHGGLGLGLAIVKSIAELHGGRAWCESAGEGKGASFAVQFPVSPQSLLRPREPEASGDGFAPRRETDDSIDLRGIELLVVDDQEDSLELLRRLLEERGATVHTASTGYEALSLIQEKHFDALISDIGMPGMDGYELIAGIRHRSGGNVSNIPAVALTAFARPTDRQRAIQAGYDVFVPKPVEPHELLSVVFQCTRRPSPSLN